MKLLDEAAGDRLHSSNFSARTPTCFPSLNFCKCYFFIKKKKKKKRKWPSHDCSIQRTRGFHLTNTITVQLFMATASRMAVYNNWEKKNRKELNRKYHTSWSDTRDEPCLLYIRFALLFLILREEIIISPFFALFQKALREGGWKWYNKACVLSVSNAAPGVSCQIWHNASPLHLSPVFCILPGIAHVCVSRAALRINTPGHKGLLANVNPWGSSN